MNYYVPLSKRSLTLGKAPKSSSPAISKLAGYIVVPSCGRQRLK